jgi:AraC family transcriptional regulator
MDVTTSEWAAAVRRSVHLMQADIGAEHPLRELARSAWFSPFHFHRVFRELTDSTPARFLAAVRMAEAKRLLLRTPASVTDICMQVGYSSLGTFTSQFTRHVGISPRRFRQMAGRFADVPFTTILARVRPLLTEPVHRQLTARVIGGPMPGVPVATGLFPTGIPQGVPASCAIVSLPGAAPLGDVPDGGYHLLAMCFHPSTTVADALIADDGHCFVGSGPAPVRVAGGLVRGDGAPVVLLRPRRPIDPPVVLALPLLLAAGATQE